ncbi:MFS transporter [Bacillus sp. ISL-51]|uniref:MFS transporter n=1 Tax=unclassified Bacillus (in: firmicutes) TaxID=185979 RepID=UPI001BED2999|nr:MULTISPECIES: MFS transporter [unclassified Bacillus (in: firmicutes)]MBT2574339.1 MFS transporter [Bacillus sp. ISL-51]MBT2633156.1 MFS transporter [Bacillus sp. ISL-26]
MKGIKSWGYPVLLLGGIGVSNIGEWIYFLSLNLIVLKETGSAFAVSVLYLIRPAAVLMTNVWAGSLIDRFNKRNIMCTLDFFRAALIMVLPLMLSVWSVYSVYCIVFLINMANAMFRPSSMAYVTLLIPADRRKRFNSLRALLESGAFLLGPAAAGLLFIAGTPIFAIWVNAAALSLSGIITMMLPNLEKDVYVQARQKKLSLAVYKEDWQLVYRFSRTARNVMIIYFLFSLVMTVMASALDSLEAAFAKDVLQLTDADYGFLVSVAGAGIIAGALVNVILIKKLPTSLLMGIGALLVSVGYMIYAFSEFFWTAALGFFLLAFFLSFANTGFLTFYQKHIPVDIMGRVGSLYSLFAAVFILLITGLFGFLAIRASIQHIVMAGAAVMLLLAVVLCSFLFISAKRRASGVFSADQTKQT